MRLGDMKLKIRLSFVFTFLLIESGIASNIRGHYVARGTILTWQINRVLSDDMWRTEGCFLRGSRAAKGRRLKYLRYVLGGERH